MHRCRHPPTVTTSPWSPTLPPYAGPFETPHDPSLSSVSRTRRVVGLVNVHDHRRSGSLQLGHLRILERLVLWSTPPTRCPSTGIGRRRRRIRRLHERIRPPPPKNNATNDFQRKIGISNSLSYSGISNSLSYSGTHATNIGKSGRLSGGPETYLPMIVGWCWKCMVG